MNTTTAGYTKNMTVPRIPRRGLCGAGFDAVVVKVRDSGVADRRVESPRV